MRKIFLSGFLLFLCCITQVQGQTKTTNPDSALQIILAELDGAPLTLENAVQHALDKSTDVRLAEAGYLAARGIVRRERGFFDPELFFSLNHEHVQEPATSFFSGAEVLLNEQTNARTGLRWASPIGTEVELSLNMVRLKTNSSFSFLNPQYTAFSGIRFRQPLLGGFHVSARKELSRAEEELQAAKSHYDQEALAVHADVEQRYWDLYASERDYAVRKLTLNQAEVFLRDTELRAQAGLVGPNQVANARTFLAEQRLLLLDAEEKLDRLSDELAAEIGARPTGEEVRFSTVDDPPEIFSIDPVETLLEQTLQGNLDLQAARSEVAAIQAFARAAGWEMLPTVDIVGSLGGNGILGTRQSVDFGDTTVTAAPDREGALGDAISEAVQRDFRTWSVGVEVSVPIGFRRGRGERDRLQAEVMMAEQRAIELARTLEEQVRTSHRELSHGQRRIQAAREGVAAAQEQVRIGLIEFRNGRTTAFELVRLGADFAAAQQRYSEALVTTAKAAADLRKLTSGKYQ